MLSLILPVIVFYVSNQYFKELPTSISPYQVDKVISKSLAVLSLFPTYKTNISKEQF